MPEDRALLENRLCYLGVSTYGDLAAIWLVPKEDVTMEDGDDAYVLPLAERFIRRIAPKFHDRFGSLIKVGSFSNGEAVFEPAQSIQLKAA